ncbi:MAG: hypothetical protein ACTSXJ_00380 [Candidatus Baldrarchaeia archaeon]
METPKVVLDTDILVGLLRDVKDIVRFVKRLEEEGIRFLEPYYSASFCFIVTRPHRFRLA